MKGILKGTGKLFGQRHIRRLSYLAVLGILALGEFLTSGLVRRTFVFYAMDDSGMPMVEDRMFSHGASREADITRYVEEVLLGPASLNSAPLFPKGTRLRSLLYREGIVYVDLSEPAALPAVEGGDVFRDLYTLDRGIRRNFSFVTDVRLFINGNEAFRGKFREIFNE
ncbi:MAG: GerMN domain-containing protein [Spirochaetaceae bacterium]|nr:GerMN domain-containing protein [Spirochaetaceae bacterium]